MNSNALNIALISDAFVKKHLSFKEAIHLIENGLIEFYQKESAMPAKQYLNLPQFNGDFRAMPAYSSAHQMAGLKWINVHPQNKEVPSVMGVMLLNDPKTGELLAMVQATELTKIRTAAVAAVAQKYLSPTKIQHLAIVGLGEQAKAQVLALKTQIENFSVSVWDLDEYKRKAFESWLTEQAIKFHSAHSLESCVQLADLIVTLTPSRQPWLKYSMLKKPVLICAMGADGPGKQELDFEILKKASVVVDDWEQASHSGEIHTALEAGCIVKEDIDAELGEVIAGNVIKKKEIVVFDSTGLAIQDLVCAAACFQKFK